MMMLPQAWVLTGDAGRPGGIRSPLIQIAKVPDTNKNTNKICDFYRVRPSVAIPTHSRRVGIAQLTSEAGAVAKDHPS
ncbi:MAG: hypothetical protein ACK4L4_16995 [Gemmobacter sp.]